MSCDGDEAAAGLKTSATVHPERARAAPCGKLKPRSKEGALGAAATAELSESRTWGEVGRWTEEQSAAKKDPMSRRLFNAVGLALDDQKKNYDFTCFFEKNSMSSF